MQVGQYTSQVATSGVTSKKMKIESNAKAFSMIIDKLYTDIKYAIVRELMTNGYDSQKEAGNPERPLHIKVPTNFDRTMAFRDYGVSMTHQVVEDVFSTLMSSTKDKAEDAVGGWGIGSKTPLGYTDQLSLRAFLKGSVRLYHIFIDAEGIPNISLINEVPTSEEDGIEISFEVLHEDIKAFTDNVKVVSKWFDILPETSSNLGFTAGPNTYKNVIGTIYEIGTEKYNSYSGGNKSMQVRQGCVAYPLDTNKLKPNDATTVADIQKAVAIYNDFGRKDGDIFIDVPIGTADVTASRDALYYSEKTCTNIVQAFVSIYDELFDALEVEWAKVTTYFQACNLETSMCGLLRDSFTTVAPTSIVRNYLSKKTFDGKPLRNSFHYKLHKRELSGKGWTHTYLGCTATLINSTFDSRERISFREKKEIDISYGKEFVLVADFLDPATGRYTHNAANRMARFHNEQPNGKQILWVQIKTVSLDGLAELMAAIGVKTYTKLSDLPLMERVVEPATEPLGKRDLYRHTKAPNLIKYSRVSELSDFEDILLADDFMYLKTYRTELASDYGMNMRQLDLLVDKYAEKGTYTPIIMVTRTTEGKLAKWIKDKKDYFEYFMDYFVSSFDVKKYVDLTHVLNMNTPYTKVRNLQAIANMFDYWDDDSKNDLLLIKDDSLREAISLMVLGETFRDDLKKLKNHLEDINMHASVQQKEKVRAKVELFSKVQPTGLTMMGMEQAERDMLRKYPWVDAINFGSGEAKRKLVIDLFNRLT